MGGVPSIALLHGRFSDPSNLQPMAGSVRFPINETSVRAERQCESLTLPDVAAHQIAAGTAKGFGV